MHHHLDPDLDIRLLRVLHVLLRVVSVSQAATLLGQSQPAVSASLRRLREVIGDPLLVRSGGHMVLTERGAALVPIVQRVLEGISSLTDPLETFEPATSNRFVRIAAANCFGPFFLPRISELLLQAAPQMRVEYCALRSASEMMRGLEDGEIDLVIGNWPSPTETLRTAPLLTTDFVCLLRNGHPLAGRHELDMETYLTLGHLSPTPLASAAVSPVDGRLQALHLNRRIVLTVPEYTVAPSILSRTDLCFTTGRPFAEHLAGSMPLSVLRAPLEFGPMSFYMLWHERLHASACNRWLRGLVRRISGEIEAFGRRAPLRLVQS